MTKAGNICRDSQKNTIWIGLFQLQIPTGMYWLIMRCVVNTFQPQVIWCWLWGLVNIELLNRGRKMWSESLLLLPPSLLPLSNPASSSHSRPHLTETTVTSDVPTLAPRDHLEQLSSGELVIYLLGCLHIFYPEVLQDRIVMVLQHLLIFHDFPSNLSARNFQQNYS